MNVEALLEVRDQILADPESLIMDEYFSGCGTRMCIAGRLAYNAGWMPVFVNGPWVTHEYMRDERKVEEVAAEILQVDFAEAQRLFHLENWPHAFQDAWDSCAETEAGRMAKIAANRIGSFILGKEVEHEDPRDPRLLAEVESEACAVA